MKTLDIGPTATFKPFSGLPIEVRLFGRNGGKTDWSIAALNKGGREKPSDETAAALRRIQRAAANAAVHALYAPNPSEFNGRVCSHGELRAKFSTSLDAAEADFPDNRPVSICRGADADGCDVPKGSAFWLSSADCPTLIVTDGEKVICAHCGYKSLVDQGALKGTPARPRFSVVDSVLDRFAVARNRRAHLQAFVTLGIRANWSEAGETEIKRLARHERSVCRNPLETYPGRQNRLNIVELAWCQCLNRGVGNARADNRDTFTDKDNGGKHLWWSYERAVGLGEKENEPKRNGVMVIHGA